MKHHGVQQTRTVVQKKKIQATSTELDTKKEAGTEMRTKIDRNGTNKHA